MIEKSISLKDLNNTNKNQSKKNIYTIDDNFSNESFNNITSFTPSKYTEKDDKSKIRRKLSYISTDISLKENEEWFLYSNKQKINYIITTIIKICIFILFLFLFLVSLNFMTIGFIMISPQALKAKNVIKYILKNPIGSLCVGIIVTAIMQNAT
jgi:hypothetical protein